MIILAIETATANSTHTASIALQKGDMQELVMLPDTHAQAAQLVPAIEALLDKHVLDYAALEALAITVGPGSFTGIRIGLAVARAMAFACPKLRLIPLTTLEAMLAAYTGHNNEVLAVLRAGKGEIFSQYFQKRNSLWYAQDDIKLSKPEVLTCTEPMIGNGIEGLTQELNAMHLLRALESVWLQPREATPLYIRPPDAKPQAVVAALQA